MNNTSKARALKYIREKNHLRNGRELICGFIVSNEMVEDTDFIEGHVISILNIASNKYKLPLTSQTQIGQEYNDFINNTSTVRITLNRL